MPDVEVKKNRSTIVFDYFTYLGSILKEQGRCVPDMSKSICIVKNAFHTNFQMKDFGNHEQEQIEINLRKIRWKWVGFSVRKPNSDINRQALE